MHICVIVVIAANAAAVQSKILQYLVIFGIPIMFLAMNRFKIVKGREADFEDIWKQRDSHLEGVDGFKNFNLVRGGSNDTYTLYASHSVWESKIHFENWTKSEAFKLAHKNAGKHSDIYLGPPKFEGFEKVI